MKSTGNPEPLVAVRLLGGATIEAQGTPLSGRAAHRHGLALVAFLTASPGRAASRDKLIACLWPEADPRGVRHRLNVTLHDLRKVLGRDAIVSVGDELRLDTGVVWVDAVRFEEAIARGDLAEAVELYRGPFLDGFHAPDAPELDDWMGTERERRARALRRVLRQQAREAERGGDFAAAVRAWRRLAREDPYGAGATIGLMRALEARGERAEALRVAERHAGLLAADLEAAPDPAVEALARRIRTAEGLAATAPPPVLGRPAPEPLPAEEREAVAAPSRRRRLGPLERLTVGAAVAALLFLISLPWVLPEGGTALVVVPDRVVVMPFAVRGGEDFQYLGDGMAEILGTTLDGVGTLKTADPHAIVGYVRRRALDLTDPAAGRRVAERFGAGRFVVGSIVESGRRLHVQATLYRADGTIEARAAAGAGSDAEFFTMVDDLTRGLVAARFDPREERMTRLAVTTSASLEALKAYLRGEALLRAGDFEAAAEAFRRATREDSTFALAWYRLAVAAEWAFQPHDAAHAVERAVDLADRLPERDRLLLVGWEHYARGEADEAEAVYLRVLDERPEEIEAWLQLGEIRFHYAPSRGRTIADSRTAFERVLALEPAHEGARIHLARVAALQGDLAALDTHVRELARRDPHSQAAVEARGLRAFATRDSATARALAAEILARGDSYLALGALMGQFHVGDVEGVVWGAELLADPQRPVEVRTAGHTILALARLATGRLAEARAAAVAAEALDPLRGAELRALMATMPFLPHDREALVAARAALERTGPRAGSPSFFLPDHNEVRPLLQAYLRGLLSAGLGEREAALGRVAELERMPSPAADPTLARDLALGLRAEILRREGKARAALQALAEIEEPAGYELVLPSPFHARARERFLKASLLEELGQGSEARAAYAATGNRSVYDLPYRAHVQLRLAGLHDRSGEDGSAAAAYRRFLALWRDADPELVPLMATARTRFAGLSLTVGATPGDGIELETR